MAVAGGAISRLCRSVHRVLVCAVVLLGQAAAQEPVSPDAAASAPAAPAAARPGLVDAVGRWLEQGAARVRSDMQGAREKLEKLGDEARNAAKDAAVSVLPGTRLVAGRERCAVAGNGAPDCEPAAKALCTAKGFASGKSIDTQSERKCPARLLLSGRPPGDIDCPTETVVTRAMCQ
jgi:hypothetical protein